LKDSEPTVTSNSLFSVLLKRKVTFYRIKLPSYASIVHPGGWPEWVVRKWMDIKIRPDRAAERMPKTAPIPKPIEDDLRRIRSVPATEDEVIAALLGLFSEIVYPID
jgi:hypothetical protein